MRFGAGLALERTVVVMSAIEHAPRLGVQLRAPSWKTAAVAILLAAVVIGAGAAGWAVRGGGDTSAVPVPAAGPRYEALANVVRSRCTGGLGNPTESAVESAFGGGYCEGAMTAMSAALRTSPWPKGATDEAVALADALDKHVAFNDRVRLATPAQQQQIIADTLKQYPNNPWMVTNRAANAMRKALGLAAIGSNVAV